MNKWAYQNRASAILFNYLKSIPENSCLLVPANACPIVLATILKAGINFKLVDLNPDTLLIDIALVKTIIAETPDNVALLFIRTYGFLDDQTHTFKQLKSMCPSLKIIDDRCLCEPNFNEENFVNDADLTLFSTGYSKYAELGRGGFGFLSQDEIRKNASTREAYSSDSHDKLVEQFNTCIKTRTRFKYQDSNWLDLNPSKQAFEEYQHSVIELKNTAKKQKTLINNIYQKLSNNTNIITMDCEYNHWRFNILVPDKKAVLTAIFDAGFFASSHYASMVGIFDPHHAPVAENLHAQVVNLFNDHRVSEQDAMHIADIVNTVAK